MNHQGLLYNVHEMNVCIKIKCHVSRAERSHNNSSQQELRPPVPHIVLRLKQVNFKAQLYNLKNRLVVSLCRLM